MLIYVCPETNKVSKTSKLHVLVFARRLDTTDHAVDQIHCTVISSLYTVCTYWVVAGTVDVLYMIRLPLSLHNCMYVIILV